MPYSSNEQTRGSGCGGKSRIDFSPSLDSIDPKCPQSPVGNMDGSVWDTETDHILSYFLGGDTVVGAMSHDESGFATIGGSHSQRSMQACSRADDSDHLQLPPTPAVHFYSHISHDNGFGQQNRDRKHSSKGSSVFGSKLSDTGTKLYESAKASQSWNSANIVNHLRHNADISSSQVARPPDSLLTESNMTISMVTDASQIDRPIFLSQACDTQLDHHSNGYHNYGSENPSPISPAALIGMANENLLLPLSYPSGTAEKFETTKNGRPLTSCVSNETKILSCHQDETYGAMPSVLENNHEIRILPPERLMEVFQNQNQPLAPVPEEDTPHRNPSSFQISSTTNSFVETGVNGNRVAIDAGVGGTQQSHVILPNQISVPMNGQHFIIASHMDLAAILNRHHSFFTQPATPPVESEEKRAKRLERNRESARKSRRKKKERLLTLGEQVNQLHNEIEGERRKHINDMVPVMNRNRLEDIRLLIQHLADGNQLYQSISDQTCVVIQQSGPNSRLMRSVLEFQYSSLKQLTLPSYQKMLLCMTLLEEKFFTSAKDEYTKRTATVKGEGKNANQNVAKTLSSKQIGDEIFNGMKEERKASSKNKKRRDAENDSDLTTVTAKAYDGSRFWPLLCFELRLSVDQEERFLATQKQIKSSVYTKFRTISPKESDTLASHRSQIAAAVVTAESLSKAVGSLSHVISRREDKTFARILRPNQLVAYQTWLADPRNRARFKKRVTSTVSLADTAHLVGLNNSEANRLMMHSVGITVGSGSKEASLQDICRRLNQVLRISMQ